MKTFTCYLFVGLLIFQNVEGTHNSHEKISSYNENSDYVDPHSFYYDRTTGGIRQPKSQKMPTIGFESFESDLKVVQNSNEGVDCRNCPYEAFTRRIINIILSNANLKEEEEGRMIGKLHLDMTMAELKAIKAFAGGEFSVRQIDAILSKVIQPIPMNIIDDALTIMDEFLINIYQHRIIYGFSLITLLVVIIASKVEWTRAKIIILIIQIMVIVSFFMTWWQLLQEAKSKLMAHQTIYNKLPDECKNGELSFYKSMLLFFGMGKGDCEKYFKAIMTDATYEVTPLHAFSHMFTKFVMLPVSIGGSFLSDFIDNITDKLPWPIKYAVSVAMIIFTPVCLIVMAIISCGGSTGIKFGFFKFYLKGREATPTPTYLTHSRQADPHFNALENCARQQIASVETISNSMQQLTVSVPSKKSNEKKICNVCTELKNSPKKVKSVEADEPKETEPEVLEKEDLNDDTTESDTQSDTDCSQELKCDIIAVDLASGDSISIDSCETTTKKNLKHRKSVQVGNGDS